MLLGTDPALGTLADVLGRTGRSVRFDRCRPCGPVRRPLAPRGRDRQVLADYHSRVRVVVPTEAGPWSVPLRELFPRAYRRSAPWRDAPGE